MIIFKLTKFKTIPMDTILGAVHSSYRNPIEREELFFSNRESAEAKLALLEAARRELNELSYRFEIEEVKIND